MLSVQCIEIVRASAIPSLPEEEEDVLVAASGPTARAGAEEAPAPRAEQESVLPAGLFTGPGRGESLMQRHHSIAFRET